MFRLKRIIAVSAFALAIGVATFVIPSMNERVSADCSPLVVRCLDANPELGDSLFPDRPIFTTNFNPHAQIDSPSNRATISVEPYSSGRTCSVNSGCSTEAAKVKIEGHATDVEDGTISGVNLRWEIDSPVGIRGSAQAWPAGSGNQIDVLLFDFAQYYKTHPVTGAYLSCTDYEIKLIATDSDRNVDTDVVDIAVCQLAEDTGKNPV